MILSPGEFPFSCVWVRIVSTNYNDGLPSSTKPAPRALWNVPGLIASHVRVLEAKKTVLFSSNIVLVSCIVLAVFMVFSMVQRLSVVLVVLIVVLILCFLVVARSSCGFHGSSRSCSSYGCPGSSCSLVRWFLSLWLS